MSQYIKQDIIDDATSALYANEYRILLNKIISTNTCDDAITLMLKKLRTSTFTFKVLNDMKIDDNGWIFLELAITSPTRTSEHKYLELSAKSGNIIGMAYYGRFYYETICDNEVFLNNNYNNYNNNNNEPVENIKNKYYNHRYDGKAVIQYLTTATNAGNVIAMEYLCAIHIFHFTDLEGAIRIRINFFKSDDPKNIEIKYLNDDYTKIVEWYKSEIKNNDIFPSQVLSKIAFDNIKYLFKINRNNAICLFCILNRILDIPRRSLEADLYKYGYDMIDDIGHIISDKDETIKQLQQENAELRALKVITESDMMFRISSDYITDTNKK
jgi:hypothetical protein